MFQIGCDALELPAAAEPHEFLDARVEVRDMNRGSADASESERELLDELIGGELAALGYGDDAGARSNGRTPLTRPFAGG